MVYSSLQAEFTRAEHNGHIRTYDTTIYGTIIVYITELISNDKKNNS